jgi:carbon-monoxide dehydrogenase medium subunit
MKLAKTKDDIAKVNAAVSVTMTDGECKDAKIALGSVAPTPIRVYGAEKILQGQKLDEQTINKAADVAGAMVKPITDVRSTAEYRAEMATVLVKDALVKAADRANA